MCSTLLFQENFVTAQTAMEIPSITFQKIDDRGCKVFFVNATKGDHIDSITFGSTDKEVDLPPAVLPIEDADANEDESVWHFTYTDKEPSSVKIVACPKEGDKDVSFFISAIFDKFSGVVALFVQEKQVETGLESDGKFSTMFSVAKKDADCLLPTKDINMEDITPKCTADEKDVNTTNVEIRGKLKDIRKPGLSSIVVDPPDEFFLLVTDVCVLPEEDVKICPTDVNVDLIIEFPPESVAGELLPTDSTSLLLAGLSQNAIWMIPTLAGIAGAGVIIRSKLQRD